MNNRCTCVAGMKMVDNRCVDVCKEDQLMDGMGMCYYCPIDEQIQEGRCVCRRGLERIGDRCRMRCADGRVEIQGICATCAMGTIYNPITKACLCPVGTFMNCFGMCEQFAPITPTCNDGQYFSTVSNRC